MLLESSVWLSRNGEAVGTQAQFLASGLGWTSTVLLVPLSPGPVWLHVSFLLGNVLLEVLLQEGLERETLISRLPC
jgi:hypothetical protein